MRSMRQPCLLAGLVFGLGCGPSSIIDDGPRPPRCVPGHTVSCACADGRTGAQVCGDDGAFEACQCRHGTSGSSGAGTASAGSGATTGGGATTGSGAGTGGGGVGGGDETRLSTGASVLIDAFVAEAGIIIVLADAVLLVDRAGEELARVDSAREITAAAFDGETLVVADRARFASYDLALAKITEGDLAEECASAVLVSDHRFVCGPTNDWDRIFTAYDARTGAFVASSDTYTYNGIPMRRIPGTDDFVTVTVDSSPSDFHLYSVLDTGEAQYVNESPYHGDFSVTDVYAFNGSPPTHLVTHEGLMLRIYGPRCSAAESSFDAECFVRDGALGTLLGAQRFVGMDNDAEGKLYGLVSVSGNLYFDPPCEAGCLVQRVDIASRTVESQRMHSLDMGAAVVVRHDPVSSALLVGYRLPGDYYFPGDPYPGFAVSLLDYE